MTVYNYPTSPYRVARDALLDMPAHVGQVSATLSWELVDHELNPIGALDILDARTINARTQADIPRRLDGLVLADTVARDVDMASDLLRPWMTMEDGSRWPLGVYVFTEPVEDRSKRNTTISTPMLDQSHILNQGTRYPFGMPPNGSIGEAISRILDQCGIATKNRAVSAAPTDMTSDPPNWIAGTTKLQILTELCEHAGLLPPYFDSFGRFVARVAPDLVNDPPDHMYRPGRVRHVKETPASLDAPNVYVVVGTGPSHAPIYAFATVDPALPFSAERRHFDRTVTKRVQGLTSTEQAQRMADALAAAGSHGGRTVSFQSTPDPRHDLFHTVEWEGAVYRETAFTIDCQHGGAMSHTLTLGGFGTDG